MHGEFVYVLRSGPFFKIGRTIDFSKRIAQLKIQLPFEIELYKVINTNDSARMEKYFHKLYASLRVNGEWFKLSEHDAAMLLLYPTSVNCNDARQVQETLDKTRTLIYEVLDQRVRDEALEKLITERVEDALSDFPDSLGDVTFADQLAFECPYPPSPEDMEWVVKDETEE